VLTSLRGAVVVIDRTRAVRVWNAQAERIWAIPRRKAMRSLFDDLDLASLAPSDRPYVVLNMVASVDGRATLDGRSAALGGPADKAVFFELRASVDAVLAGTGTLRAEGYGRLVRKPERIAQRVHALAHNVAEGDQLGARMGVVGARGGFAARAAAEDGDTVGFHG